MNLTQILAMAQILGQAVMILKNPALLSTIFTLIMSAVTLTEGILNNDTPDNKKKQAVAFIDKAIETENAIFLNLTSEQMKFITETLIPNGIDLMYNLMKNLGIFKSNKAVVV